MGLFGKKDKPQPSGNISRSEFSQTVDDVKGMLDSVKHVDSLFDKNGVTSIVASAMAGAVSEREQRAASILMTFKVMSKNDSAAEKRNVRSNVITVLRAYLDLSESRLNEIANKLDMES
jgi:hypothetical protein